MAKKLLDAMDAALEKVVDERTFIEFVSQGAPARANANPHQRVPPIALPSEPTNWTQNSLDRTERRSS